MSINWEALLPQKNFVLDEVNEFLSPNERAENRMREDCLNALKSAESRGEICKPLSVEEIERIIRSKQYPNWHSPDKQAEAIHRAMTNKGGKA